MSSSEISEWKGEDIVFFQEELEKAVNGRISSKWFYTHMKSQGEQLPRIDVLNLLSQFVGYQNWTDFAGKKTDHESSKKVKITKKSLLIFAFFFSVLLIVLFSQTQGNYTIQIIDFDTNKAPKEQVQFEWLQNGESSRLLTTDSLGRITLPINESRNSIIVRSPYYKKDTIVRIIETEGGEIFKIKTDDYALMVDYFSSSRVDDWKKRRNILKKIFHKEVKVIEVIGNNIGVEFYNKSEFINRLTLPLSSLKSLDILSIKRQDGKIINMRVKRK
jgi:hypothetical protein